MIKPTLHLSIVSQEKVLETVEVTSLSAPTTEGEITVLPGHIPLFSKLQTGELRYQVGKELETFAISKGFLDVGPDGEVTVIVDAVTAARDVSIEKAEAAVKAAQHTMTQTTNAEELMMAEASLRLALLEIKIAQKTKRAGN